MAMGLDECLLLKKMQDTKSKYLTSFTIKETLLNWLYPLDSIIPSMDDFDMVELKNIVEELQHEHNLKEEDEEGQIDSSTKTSGENGGSGDNSDTRSAMALFDKLQAKED